MGFAVVVLLVHGYHPFAEDGGLYASGVEYLLHPGAFPHYTAFVTEHLRFSLFAPVFTAALRVTHLRLEPGLFLAYVLCSACTFAAADRVLRHAVLPTGRAGGLLLLALWWTLPVAGTSLFLEDPYLTARTASAFLSLFALSVALERRSSGSSLAEPWKRVLLCVFCLGSAAALHPLMCGYALGLLLCVLAARSRHTLAWALTLGAGAVLLAAALQLRGAPETAPVIAADVTRYYWFPSEWQSYELLGLLGPLVVLWALQQWAGEHLAESGTQLCRACLLLGALSIAVAVLFAHASFQAHTVARLQPLRAFAMIYMVMVLLLGAVAASWWKQPWQQEKRRGPWKLHRALPLVAIACLAAGMFVVQRLNFAHSDHLELPGRMERSPNPWVQAFLWIRQHTPEDAVFAADAHYITQSGEDAQTLRAIAQRSALPDYSKDGGEAAITPALAGAWQIGVAAQSAIDAQTDEQREARLRPLGADWMILAAQSVTRHSCPYQNAVLKVCRLTP